MSLFQRLTSKIDAKASSSLDSDEQATGTKVSGANGHQKADAGTSDRPQEPEVNRELIRKLHKFDPNLDREDAVGLDKAAEAHDVERELELVNLIESDSPYAEVRAAVRNYDTDMPCSTIRAWVIGMILVTLGAAMNMLFSLRQPSIVLTSFVSQLVAHPLGLLWDRVMPSALCNGPWNYKEHTVIVIMSNVAFSGGSGVAYSTDTIVAMKGFYGIDFGWGFNLLLTISMQMLGYGIAGMMRRFLVYPGSMLWPSNFVNTSLFYALHDVANKTNSDAANGWSISRYRYFLYVFLGSFFWYFFPGWIFGALSYFDFPTWIAPKNVVVNQLFGYNSGLGLIPITFDWTQVTGYSLLSPLMFPFHGIMNTLIGVVIFFILTSIGLHYGGWFYSLYVPMSTSTSYDNMGKAYNVTKILTPQYTLDLQKYQEYSPLFLSTTFALTYGLSFATITALVSHTALFHGQEIWTRARLAFGEEPDIHVKLMKKYKECPDWWYGVLFLVMLALCFTTCLHWETGLPWWAVVVCLGIAAAFIVPVGTIQATTNIQLGLNVITEFIIGYMVPGAPIGMMLFKSFGYITMLQALYFCQDLKLGTYMKIPPRVMFTAQVIATLWSCIVQIAVLYWAFGTIPDICSQDQPNRYTCPGSRVFFTASIIWGLIGPQRLFSAGQIYNKMMLFFVAGLVAPPVFYILARIWPRSSFRYLNAPLIFGGANKIPPAQIVNYTSWAFYGWIFNRLIRNRYRGWWSHYSYLTSAGLDTGLAICTILIFLTLQLTGQQRPQWWGNLVYQNTLDWNYTAVNLHAPKSGTFGPKTW